MKKKFLAFALAATMTFANIASVFAADADTEAKYAALMIEATDGTNYCSATSDGDIWGADGTAETHKEIATMLEGNEYAVTMTRSGNNFEVVFQNNATGEKLFDTLKLSDTNAFGENTVVYIAAQVGDMDVTVEVKENNDSTVNPSADSRNNSVPQNIKGIDWWDPANEKSAEVSIGDGEVITFTVKVNSTVVSDDTETPDDTENPTTPEDPATSDEVSVVVVPEEEIAAIAENATVEGVEEDVELVVNEVAEEDVETVNKLAADNENLKDKDIFVLDLKLMKGDEAVQPGQKISVTLPILEGLKDAKYVSVFRLDGDKLTDLGAVEVKDGKFTFETDHFTTYIFAAADAPRAAEVGDTAVEPTTVGNDANVGGSKPDTGDSAPIVPIIVLAVVALGGVISVAASKKRA